MIITICDTSILAQNQQPYKDFRQRIKEWLRANYLNKSFSNTETGYEIFINNVCIGKMTNTFGTIKAHVFSSIPNIIKNAMFVGSEDDNRERPDFIKILRFESLVDVDGEMYQVWMFVRQTKTQNLLYSLNVDAQKKL